ncbi:MAG TPA: GDP-mannose 4,6-dehydratase [Thermoanaerobaculia bacterium]|jgi:GDP-4-dehydro-6-deoxy-D-mannose reductase|nr:GDP-mannose 4,6-dehydratase [Thermoanaerobaculia bacterium]
MRVLVTGIGGFLGQHLAERLLDRGHSVVGTTWGTTSDLAGIELHEVDLLDAPGLSAAVHAAAPEAIIHLAGLSHVGESWQRPADYFQVNVLGTENVLDAAATLGKCRVLLASSAEVYGLVPEEHQPIVETEPVAPRTPYALTKAAAERLTVRAGGIVTRCFNLVGPGQSDRFALPAFAGQLAAIKKGEQEPVLKVGNLSARRDFVHVADGVAALALLAEQGAPGEIYNVAAGRAFSIAEALDRLIAISGLSVEIQEDPSRLRPVDMPLLEGNAEKIRALGWKPEKDLDAALGELWAAVRG